MKKVFFSLLLAVSMLLTVRVYAERQTQLSKNVIRLHVIANSDSEADQEVKLAVRDAILEAFSSYTVSDSKQSAEDYIKNNLRLAEETANRALEENGFLYKAKAEYGHFPFPVRHYGNVTLPAGMYDGLRIHLGEGIGQNWWCVMYPPLCFNDKNSTANATDNEHITFQFKFKFMEILKSL